MSRLSMRLPWVTALAALLACAPSAARACSICRCDDPEVVVPGDSRFVARGFRVSFETDRNSKDQGPEFPGDPRERETEMRYTLTGAWTVRPHVALLARLPWSARRIEAGTEPVQTHAGLADPELLANWCVLSAPGAAAPHWITLQLGVRSPWGANDATRPDPFEGVFRERLDEHLQSGTGAVGASMGASAFVRVAPNDVLFGSALGRWNGANRHGYRYGDVLVTSLAWQHELTRSLQGTLELDGRTAAADRIADVATGSTGGHVLYVTPRLQVRITPRVAIRAGAQLPVASDLFGDQSERANFQTSLALIP